MHALVLAVTLASPAQCPGGRCGPTELNFSVRRGGYSAPRAYAPAPAYYLVPAAPAYERPRTRAFYFSEERRGLLGLRYSRRYYFYDGR